MERLMGLLARKDIDLREKGGRTTVEARTGGAEWRSVVAFVIGFHVALRAVVASPFAAGLLRFCGEAGSCSF
ncbi:hypothetical protein GCM10010109_87200 [Actinoplanes campanulatus]|nr:hypothetical protein GCM10010109_87200 [Actinoplanes campanulatus]GID41881.1 hypothetical protein Aca09nite_83870 [Actinoplanes campanulatus]